MGGLMKLKGLIYSQGLNQWTEAKRLGWTESHLSRLITGRQVPTNDEFIALSGVLGVPETKLRKLIEMKAS
jgi:transcriptional regulator with XRE-family HTH domain